MPNYQLIQTFYIDPEAVNRSTDVLLTSIDLFFRTKPDLTDSISGSRDPGVNIAICEVINNVPNTNEILRKSVTRIGWDQVNAYSKPTLPTTFRFPDPVFAKTGSYYGICIYFEDPLYSLWQNVQGQNLVGDDGATSTPSPGSAISKFDGVMYTMGVASIPNDVTVNATYRPHVDRDLKFAVNIAQFNLPAGGFDIPIVNKEYEFFTINTRDGPFIGGETVYIQQYANGASTDAPGTVSFGTDAIEVVGTGTSFFDFVPGQDIILTNGSAFDSIKIALVEDEFHLLLDRAPIIGGTNQTFKVTPVGTISYTNYLDDTVYLANSTATNAQFSFTANCIIKGVKSLSTANVFSVDKLSVDSFKPRFRVGNPAFSSMTINQKFANSINSIDAAGQTLLIDQLNTVTGYDAFILSRSQEVLYSTLYNNETDPNLYSRKSSVANVHFDTATTGNSFQAPFIIGDQLDLYVYNNQINNVYLDPITALDTEIEKNGLALCKYISKKASFDLPAEDIIVYLTAYRPKDTEIRVYAKIKNGGDNETFDDKSWTPLQITNNFEKFSDPVNENDLVEYTYGLPQFPGTAAALAGVFSTTEGSAIVTTTSNQSSSLAAGDLIRLYNTFLPQNHEVFVVQSIDSPTQITLSRAVTNLNVIGAVAGEKMQYKNIAFNNIANDNVVRYYSSSMIEFDGYNQMQIKIVLLASDTYRSPQVEDIRVIGVSV
jgi:hypothetical protein